jgi:hypothetical protein
MCTDLKIFGVTASLSANTIGVQSFVRSEIFGGTPRELLIPCAKTVASIGLTSNFVWLQFV